MTVMHGSVDRLTGVTALKGVRLVPTNLVVLRKDKKFRDSPYSRD